MKLLSLKQGSPEWAAHRAQKWNASDAPAMLGESPHCTRAELLHRMATGIAPDVDDATQRRFDAGHAVEKLLIEHASKIVGEPLHPFVGVADFDDRYSASLDGCTFVGDETGECKLLNARLRAAFADMETIAPEHRERSAAQCLPVDYRIQMEQQLRIAGAERCLFLTGELRDDGTLGDTLSCWYYPDDALWKRIQDGWAQFAQDLAAYVPPAAVERIVAAPIEALPSVSVQVSGTLAIRSNLDVFGAKLREFVAGIPKAPSSDTDFANAEAACKALKRAEEALDSAETQAIAQASSIEELTRSVSDLRNIARTARLATEKLVKARKEQLRGEEVARGRSAIGSYVVGLNLGLGGDYVPMPAVDFGSAISGLKSIDSIRNAIDTAVAAGKIEASNIANGITRNQATARELVPAYLQHLFPDLKGLLLKPADDFRAQVQARMAQHRAAEEKRMEAERERIRAEELARLEREQMAAERELQAQEREAAIAAQPPAEPQLQKNLSAAPSVVPMPMRTAVAQQKATLTVGAVSALMGPGCTLTRDFITRTLGVAGTEGERAGTVLFSEADADLICESFKAHLTTIQHQLAQKRAA
jgi:predicted phage-related endonuclease